MGKPIDLSEFEIPSGPRGPRCGVAQALDQVTAAEKVKLAEALNRTTDIPGHRRIKTSEIVHWLKERGISSNATVVGRHRRGECACK